MSTITIDLNNFTAVKLNEWLGGVEAAEAVKAMIHMSRHDPDFRGQVSDRLDLHSAVPEASMSRITIDLDNTTDQDLMQAARWRRRRRDVPGVRRRGVVAAL